VQYKYPTFKISNLKIKKQSIWIYAIKKIQGMKRNIVILHQKIKKQSIWK